MKLRNYLYIISICIVNLSCFGASHDESPFANGNAGWVPEYNSDDATGTILLVNTYYVEPVDSPADSDNDEQNNGNAGWTDVSVPALEEMDIEEDADEDMDEEHWWITPVSK